MLAGKVCRQVLFRDHKAAAEEDPWEGQHGNLVSLGLDPGLDQALVVVEYGPYGVAGALEMGVWDWSWSETLELQETHCN